MAVLILADRSEDHVSVPTRSAVAAATQIDADVHVLVLGGDAAAQAAAKLPSVTKVLSASGPAYEHGLAEPAAGRAVIDIGLAVGHGVRIRATAVVAALAALGLRQQAVEAFDQIGR